MIIATTPSTCSGSFKQDGRIEQHAYRHEEQYSRTRHAAAVIPSAARWLNSDSRITMPAKNAPSANDTLNSRPSRTRSPTATAITHSVNNSREPVRAICHSSQGNTRRPTISIKTMKAPTCRSVIADRQPSRSAVRLPAPLPCRPEPAGQRRQQYQYQHHGQVFDHQPADGDSPVQPFRARRASSARSSTTVLATDRQVQRPGRRRGSTPTECAVPSRATWRQPSARSRRAMRSLRLRSRSSSEKCKPDAEHQQHHADLGQLTRDFEIGHEAGRGRTNRNSRQQISDDRRQPQARSDKAEQQRQPERRGQGGDQRNVVRHVQSCRNYSSVSPRCLISACQRAVSLLM